MSVSKYAGVKFTSSYDYSSTEVYYFRNSEKIKLEKYDTVLVDTRYGIQLAVVEDLLDEKPLTALSGEITKSILEKIESKHMAGIQTGKKIKDIKEQIKKRAKKIDEMKVFETYAESDLEIAAMLDALKELQK